MPLPQATGWVAPDWFPRVVGFGFVPPYEKMERPFPEVLRKYIPDNVLRPAQYDQADPFHLTCGASLGLQFPYLQCGESVALQSIHPTRPDFSFRLPSEKPKIWTDGRKGQFNPTEPVIHTVVIEPDESRLSIVWAEVPRRCDHKWKRSWKKCRFASSGRGSAVRLYCSASTERARVERGILCEGIVELSPTQT